MKRMAPAFLLALILAFPVRAQTGGVYSLQWHTLDGGGQTFATGGAYRLGSTTGQPDAGRLSGGVYEVDGGFWNAGASPSVAVPPAIAAPVAFAVRPPAPNPFRVSTTFAFDLPSAVHVRIAVHGVGGRLVRRLADGDYEAGHHRATWDGRDDGGHPVASGIYFARLSAGDLVSTRRIVRLN